MKISQFNVVSEIDGRYLVFNTLTTSMVLLDKETYESVFLDEDYTNPNVKPLLQMGIIKEDSVDEYNEVVKIRKAVMSRCTGCIEDSTILLTTACNARCYYCFEKGIESRTLSFDQCDAVIEFLVSNSNKKNIWINWFGGEPLLAFDKLRYINDGLLNKGIKVSSQITTNGLLLTDEIIEYFSNSGIKVIQITIDDIGAEYARIKNYITACEDPFKTVVENINKALNAKLFVRIRINYELSKIDYAKKIYAYIKALFGSNSYLKIYLAVLSLHNEKKQLYDYSIHPYLEMLNFSYNEKSNIRLWKDDKNLLPGNEMLKAFFLSPIPLACGVERDYGIIINADGLLYKCHRLAGRKEFSCGDIYNGIQKDSRGFTLFCKEEISDEKCRTCTFLPLCHGGCKANRFLYPENSPCIRTKDFAKELVKMYYLKYNKSEETSNGDY